jgi:hypothetical protein
MYQTVCTDFALLSVVCTFVLSGLKKVPVGAGLSAVHSMIYIPRVLQTYTRARILNHLLEAEKLTFRGKLSFQRLECTAGLTLATIFALVF